MITKYGKVSGPERQKNDGSTVNSTYLKVYIYVE